MEGKDIVSNFLNSLSSCNWKKDQCGEDYLKEKIAKVALDWDYTFF